MSLDVLLAINDNKANGTTAFADQSNAAHALTANGAVQYATTSPPTGMTSSGSFDGSASFVSSLDSVDWFMWNGNATAEMYVNTTQGTANAALVGQADAGFSTGAWMILFNSAANDGKVQFWLKEFSAASALLTGATSIRSLTWPHIAVTRYGNVWTLWINGVSDATATQATKVIDGAFSLTVGRQPGIAARDYVGNIASLRLTKGDALYKTSFTPPTLPLPAP